MSDHPIYDSVSRDMFRKFESIRDIHVESISPHGSDWVIEGWHWRDPRASYTEYIKMERLSRVAVP
jgi:hypothetical protein